MGYIRPPAQAPTRGPWAGDVAQGTWYASAELPLWINGHPTRRLIRALAFTEASTALLGLTYLVMSLG